MEQPLFEQVADAVRSMAPEELGEVQSRWHRRGVKLWFGTDDAPRAHYEAQVLPRRHVDGTDGLAIEVGFHGEHRDPEVNAALLDRLRAAEAQWRPELGDEAEAGAFFGNDAWVRVSEAWVEPDLDDPELVLELATRVVDYLAAIEPVLTGE